MSPSLTYVDHRMVIAERVCTVDCIVLVRVIAIML